MEQGFNINGKFFPLVHYEDWLNQDFVLARDLTHITTLELFADPLLLEQALIAIAFKHANPHLRNDQVLEYIGSLKPSDVQDVGFDDDEAPDPLAGSGQSENDGSSSPSSDASTEPDPASSPTTPSGNPGSDTGSPELTSPADPSDS